jgi:pimeloyl-ACP methyl ester carboxylesterase
MSRSTFGDVVVLLPGITGSVLVQGEGRRAKEIWAPKPGAVLRGLLSLGRSLQALTVENDDWRVDDLGDGVHVTALVDAAHIIPGLWKIDVYSRVETALIEGLGLTRGQNYFPFPYDWRRDNRASARRLQQQADAWLRSWRDRSGNADAQLVLVAHSMGGLVSRYFVEALGGWEMTRAVVTFGTPFYGSLNAVDFLVNGYQKGLGPFRSDLTPLLRSMTSLHQLVPYYRCIDAGAARAVTPGDAGLPHWGPDWTDHLDGFQSEMGDAARSNREDPRFEGNPVAYHPITGCDQQTRQSARLRDGSLAVLFDREGKDEGGDGTVPLISAALSGTEPMRTFGPERHSRLQGNDGLLGHLGGLLSSLHDPKISDLRAIETRFSLVLDDVVLPGEPIRVGVKPISSLPPHLLRPEVKAEVSLRLEGGGIVTRREMSLTRDAINDVELGEAAPGTYIVQVTAADAAPISDVLAVASPQDVEGELSTMTTAAS